MTTGGRRPLVVTFAHDPGDAVAARLVDAAAALADGVGAERAGVFMRVPVRVRSAPLGLDGALRPVLPEADILDVLVFLQSQQTAMDPGPWTALLEGTKAAFAERGRLLFLAVALDPVPPPPTFAKLQTIRWSDWKGLNEEQSRVRALIRIVAAIRERLGAVSEGERTTVFVSHAKRDGRTQAEAVIRHIRDPENALGLGAFYDALELRTGEDYREGLEEGVRSGALLALVSDTYEGRPWCSQEVLWAKRYRRPVLLVDVGRQKVSRTYPYLGNLPLRRHDLGTALGREAAILDLVVEMLRIDLFQRVAEDLGEGIVALPRPPELLDLAELLAAGASRVVYPDPPLADQELALLQALAPGLVFETLEEALR